MNRGRIGVVRGALRPAFLLSFRIALPLCAAMTTVDLLTPGCTNPAGMALFCSNLLGAEILALPVAVVCTLVCNSVVSRRAARRRRRIGAI